MSVPRPKSKQEIPQYAEKVFSGILFDAYQWKQELYDGTSTTFERLKRTDTAVIIPVLEDGTILLVKDEQPGRDAVLTPPGGRLDPGEDGVTAAKRELLEETGYEAEEVELWFANQPASKIDWAVYYFVGRRCRKVREADPGAGEKITLVPVSFADFIARASTEDYQSPYLVANLLRAQLDTGKMDELRKLFFGK